ncbi:MAG: 2-C-methyl-D-erythritol 2,4-cyclodiphosphate synthase [Burkholderiales bacterium]|nr:2-C-methyl-D-erythritol 2,4-cyclodiphosphate synthase [Burkholderiales bacterium]
MSVSPSAAAAPRCFAVVPAGGVGARLGAGEPKQYLSLAGRSMLQWSVQALLAADWIERVLVVVAPGDERAGQLLAGWPRVEVLARGGATRRDTVSAGLAALAAGGAAAGDWVLVHDAARPGLERDALERLRAEVADSPVGGLLAVPVGDTVKRCAVAGDAGDDAAASSPSSPARASVAATVPRDHLWLAQTPQMFRLGLLADALRRFDATDEASAIEQAGHAPRLIEGARDNFKVTTADDLRLMRQLLEQTMTARFRIGQGYDVHALVPGRPLIIGGIEIAHTHGLLGHSDADVLLHAITDALFGAAALGDIGRHFPDTEQRWRGADSFELLREATRRVRAAGWQPGNVDATVIAQVPRLAPHLPAMGQRIARALEIDVVQVNIKAKTNERLGFLGRSEGIAAEAVVLLESVRSEPR